MRSLPGSSPSDVPAECHPSPSRAARRSAAGLSPPTHSGTCGFCTGFGVTAQSLTWKYCPEKLGFFSVQSVLTSRRYSSMRRPRSWKDSPRRANSSAIQPTPTPKITRPPERWSALAICLAVMIGCRIGSTVTLVPMRIRVVRAAR